MRVRVGWGEVHWVGWVRQADHFKGLFPFCPVQIYRFPFVLFWLFNCLRHPNVMHLCLLNNLQLLCNRPVMKLLSYIWYSWRFRVYLLQVTSAVTRRIKYHLKLFLWATIGKNNNCLCRSSHWPPSLHFFCVSDKMVHWFFTIKTMVKNNFLQAKLSTTAATWKEAQKAITSHFGCNLVWVPFVRVHKHTGDNMGKQKGGRVMM